MVEFFFDRFNLLSPEHIQDMNRAGEEIARFIDKKNLLSRCQYAILLKKFYLSKDNRVVEDLNQQGFEILEVSCKSATDLDYYFYSIVPIDSEESLNLFKLLFSEYFFAYWKL